jgi:uncharacterized membrane protein
MTYSMAVSMLMAVLGVLMLLVRYGKLKFAYAENWEQEYQISQPLKEKKVVEGKVKEAISIK